MGRVAELGSLGLFVTMSFLTRQVTGAKVDRAVLFAFVGLSGILAVIGQSAEHVWVFWVLCVACILWGLFSLGKSLTAWARRKWPLKCAIVLGCLFAAYLGAFSYWWLTSPLEVMRLEGGVRIHARKLVTRRIPNALPVEAWQPAFWFMVHVRGYRYYGFIAAFEDSAYVYGRETAQP